MYISRIVDRNLGPISKIDISPSFNQNGTPKPLIIVGENGSGKSTLISNIVDSFYELAGKCFTNALHQNEGGLGYAFYKTISYLQIKSGEKYLFSRILFDNKIEYLFKAGECSFNLFKEESGYSGEPCEWDDDANKKQIQGLLSEKEIERIFFNHVICYFGPERYEKPSWLGDSYYDDEGTHLFVEPRFSGKLQNTITAFNMGKENFRWLLDVIVDSRTDIEKVGLGLKSIHVNLNDLCAMSQARSNVETVMGAILGEDVYFGLNLRQDGGGRFNIRRKSDESVIAPTMDSLSTGQLALFNIFATIIRYADNNDINKSIHLDQITGIVVIDEIELHLHSIHQKEVLPRLMTLFPMVQFIITTHSPLFLLGLEEKYNKDGFDIYQMPDGIKIGAELFSEFNRAYLYFTNTEKHHEELRNAIDKSTAQNVLIITEGATDWKHLKAAYNDLSKKDEYSAIFESLYFDFFQYEPANSSKDSEYKIAMGNAALVAMCETYSKIPQKRKLIFIADCDDKNTNQKMSIQGQAYKKWGNNVFSLILPVPDSRKHTPNICIEHLYCDEEIKTEYMENGISRRLYIGNEFDCRGISTKLGKICEKKSICGPGKITIIEGSTGEKVTDIHSDGEVNYALSKMKFAECVMEKAVGFENFDFSNFIKIFRIIRKIVMEDI